MEYYSAIENNEIMPLAPTWMNLESITRSEVSQKRRQISYHLYVESKKMIQMNLFTKQKHTFRHRKQIYSYQRGKVGAYVRNLGLTVTYY